MNRSLPLYCCWLLVCGLVALGCDVLAPELPPLSNERLQVPVSTLWSVRIEGATLPTDVASWPGGQGFVVLDGYHNRVVAYDANHEVSGEWSVGDAPVRLTPRHQQPGWWLTHPGTGTLSTLDPTTEQTTALSLDIPGISAPAPVAVVDTQQGLMVGLRTGEFVLINPMTGAAEQVVEQDDDGERMGAIADARVLPGGSVAVVDSLGAQVHLFNADNTPRTWFGHRGNWVGYLQKPKAVAPGPMGTLLVVDSALRAVQVFESDGTPLGVLTKDGEPLAFEHPMAIEPAGNDTWLVLDAGTATVWGVTLGPNVLAAARARAQVRHLRYPLAAPSATASEPARCVQCHDGVVNDDRQVWDPVLAHHPLDKVPTAKVPDLFPLEDDGTLGCRTCHSPHGSVSLQEARHTEGEQVGTLVRHLSSDSLFTRVSRQDSGLCLACHTTAAHDNVLARFDLGEGGHPTGRALEQALAARTSETQDAGLPAGINGGCLGCHSPHAARGDALLHSEDTNLCVACHPHQRGMGHHPESHALSCTTCHDLQAGIGRALVRNPSTLCTECHSDVAANGGHLGIPNASGVSCLGCHNVHNEQPTDHLLKTPTPTCVGCHTHVSHQQPGQAWQTSGHPLPEQGCMACHPSVHNPRSKVASCTDCHNDAEHPAGGHGGAACIACHHPHRPLAVLGEPGIHPAEGQCLVCHGEGQPGSTQKITNYRHPTPVFDDTDQRWHALASLPLYTREGKRADQGKNGELVCQSCHVVHGGATANDTLRRDGWKEACSACHGTNALLVYRWFHSPQRRKGATP